MDVTPEAYAALARSSPWRWSMLHLRHRDEEREVEAWVARPGRLLVRREGHRDERVVEPLEGGVDPRLLAPTLRADGLVRDRPDEWSVERSIAYGDPMYGDYAWVAMLDPVELSHHVRLEDVREGAREGRGTWWATARPQEGYDPRCGCCPLLWSEISDRDEGQVQPAGTTYPDAYAVALDVETGVVVEVVPRGGGHRDFWFAVTILEVDGPVPEEIRAAVLSHP